MAEVKASNGSADRLRGASVERIRYLHDLLAKAYALFNEYMEVKFPKGRVVKLKEIKDMRKELKVRLGDQGEGIVTIVYDDLPLVYLLFDKTLAPLIGNPLDIKGENRELIVHGYKRTVREKKRGKSVRVRRFAMSPRILYDGAMMLNSPIGPIANVALKSVLSDEAYDAVQRVADEAARTLEAHGLPPDPSLPRLGIPLYKQVDGMDIFNYLYVKTPDGRVYDVMVRKLKDGGYVLRMKSEHLLPDPVAMDVAVTPTTALFAHSSKARHARPATHSEVEAAIRLAESLIATLSALLVYKRLALKECEKVCVDYGEYFGRKKDVPEDVMYPP